MSARRITTGTGPEQLLRDQWHQLRTWVATRRVLDHGDEPCGLGEWTIRDLVAHLGYGLHMIAEVTPAPAQPPTSIGAYIAGYAPAGEQIAADTLQVSAGMGNDVLPGVDQLAERAWNTVDAGMPEVVLGRRGPLTRDDFLRTRLIELVTHGDDLHRALGPELPSPLRPEAVTEVAATFAGCHEQRTGRPPSSTGLDLIREATGRAPSSDAAMPLLA